MGRGRPRRVEPYDMDPDEKGILRTVKPREEGLSKIIKPNETQTPIPSETRAAYRANMPLDTRDE